MDKRQTMSKDFKQLAQDLKNNNSDIRRDAASALGKLGDVRAVEPLIGILKDKNSNVRRTVVEALGQLGDVRAVEQLIDTLKDEDWWVRQAVGAALEKLDEFRLVEARPKILIVDDQIDVRDLVCCTLEPSNYEIIQADNGAQCIELTQTEHPNLILLDIMMPGSDIDGIEACRRLKVDTSTADITICILSAKGQDIDIETGKRAGADDYMTKPFSPLALIEKCETLFALFGVDAPEALASLQKESMRLRRQCKELADRIERLRQTHGGRAPIHSFSELGSLISGVVHDLKGGLGVIHNTAGFMLDDLDTDDTLVDDVHKIIHSAEFCEVVIRNLLALSGGDAFEPTEVNLEVIVREVSFILEHKLVDINLVIDTDPNLSTIMADEGQMKQLFMNLIKNAGEAMPEGGTLTVRTRHQQEMVQVEISDTGTGVVPENLDRIFDLYFTTKEKGFGVGLYIVKGIVERHGGTISVASTVGHGTTFTLLLPIE